MAGKIDLHKICHVNTNEKADDFVGIVLNSNKVSVNFPIGYEMPKDDEELRKDIKTLIKILSRFTDKDEQTIHIKGNKIPKQIEYPINAYMYIIKDYINKNGRYYVEKEEKYKLNASGKINWAKTIKKVKPFFQDDSPIYLDTINKYKDVKENTLITKIHKYFVYESFQQIGWLYPIGQPSIPDIHFQRKLFLSVLYKKLSSTNKEDEKTLFHSMISIIEFMDHNTVRNTVYYGTEKFEHVWEQLIDNMFGIKNNERYFPRAVITERYGSNKGVKSTALEPDSIMLFNGKVYVLDSKYYRYGISNPLNKKLHPTSHDINKQVTYGQYAKKVSRDIPVFNAFIMPFNSRSNAFGENAIMLNVTESTGDWIIDPKKWELVQGIVIDTTYVLRNYSKKLDSDKNALSKEIEKYF